VFNPGTRAVGSPSFPPAGEKLILQLPDCPASGRVFTNIPIGRAVLSRTLTARVSTGPRNKAADPAVLSSFIVNGAFVQR